MILKKKKELILKIVLLIAIIYILSSSSLHYKIGNVFFGQVSSLYNVNLANLFFRASIHPIIGNPPLFAHYQLSRTYFIKGDLDQALAEAQKELEVYPENIRTYYILGLTLGYMNREHEAIDAFSKFIEANPETWAARNDKAWLQFRIGDMDGALATMKPISYMKNNPWVQNTYGTILMNKKDYKGAMEAFNQALNETSMMTTADWGEAYPGNDPRIYAPGLNAMKLSIEENIKLLNTKLDPQ
ncbi:MAG: system TPR-repeat lipoprotein [Candidatus Nomurabacteria bacterium]|nr:system TPR-repeat lipoprotein [Candidatus Nomurabacteria bacterium]